MAGKVMNGIMIMAGCFSSTLVATAIIDANNRDQPNLYFMTELASTGNEQRKADRSAEWGGACTCPDGRVYNVRAHHINSTTNCDSLACYGGVSTGCSSGLFSATNQGIGSENKNAVLCGVPTRGLGEWHGDMWIPPLPDRQLISNEEAQRLVLGKSIAFFGDSLGRHLSANFAEFLVHAWESEKHIDSGHFIDMAKHNANHNWNSDEPTLPTKSLIMKWAPLSSDSLRECNKIKAKARFDIVVLAIGVHDVLRVLGWCSNGGRCPNNQRMPMDEIVLRLENLLDCLLDISRQVIWRTAPSAFNTQTAANAGGWITDDLNHANTAINERVQNFVDEKRRSKVAVESQSYRERLTVVDFNNVMRLHDHGNMAKLHMGGDTPEHYNGMAREVEVQLILRAIANKTGEPGQ
jgi:hypothetical protein